MFSQMLIGAFLICLTVIMHALALDRLLDVLEHSKRFFPAGTHKISIVTLAVMGCFLALIAEIWVWSLAYLCLQALPDLETALYFSTATFTTAGFGDVVLNTDWRLLSSFQSANGFILFGWSTAFIFEIISKTYEETKTRKAH